MLSTLHGVRIRGVCAAVPKDVYYFEDELKFFPFPEKTSRRLGKVMGFKEHRISDPQTTVCDLASYALDYLFQKGLVLREKIQGIIFVSQMADHPMPGNSKVMHGQLDLPQEALCTDMYENCIGFISGLHAACAYIASGAMDEVLLITSDVGACHANKLDRNTYPLCGDAAAVTVVCRSDAPEDNIPFVFRNDGSARDVLIIPAGGCRMPRSEATARLEQDEMGNFRSLESLHMDGTAVFQFVMNRVPPLIDEICAYAGVAKEDIAWHLTHQPNRFMLEKLADLLGVPRDKLPNNVVEFFGNTSAVTIPVNMAFNLGKKLLDTQYNVCFSAFGAGLSLAAALTRLGPLDFCELIEHPGHGTFRYGEKTL